MPRKTPNTPAPTDEPTAPAYVLPFRRAERYVWREIERPDQEPLRVKVRDLSVFETDQIVYTNATPISEVYKQIAPYVVEWNLTAENEAGEIVPAPPPAEYGWQVLMLLDAAEGGTLVAWLKTPQTLLMAAEKKSLMQSVATHTRQPDKASGSRT